MRIILVLLIFSMSSPLRAENGVSPTSVIFGRSTNLTGVSPSGYIERGYALAAAFHRINSAGGVNGRRLELEELDDGYEPAKTVANTKKLIEDNKVFALLGYAGTPTTKAVLPYVLSHSIPFIPITAAEFLRHPVEHTVFNIREGYFAETKALVQFAVNEKKLATIGAIYQDDAFGAEGLADLQRFLAETSAHLLVKSAYLRNAADVSRQIIELVKQQPAAIFIFAQSTQAAQILKALEQDMSGKTWHPLVLISSNALTQEFLRSAGRAAEHAIYPQSLPFPDDLSLKIVQDYHKDMIAGGHKDFGGLGLEAYIAGLITAEGLRRAGSDPTRESFISGLEAIHDFNLGGISVGFSPNDHQATHSIILTTVASGKLVKYK